MAEARNDAYSTAFIRCSCGSLHKNIQLMMNFLKALFLVLHFSY